MAARLTTKAGWKVNIVWDRQNEFAGHAKTVFQTGLRLGVDGVKNKLGELMFKDKSGVGGLQAADLLAHASYKRTSLDVGVNAELDMATLRLRPMTHKRIRLYDREGLRRRLEFVDPSIREHSVTTRAAKSENFDLTAAQQLGKRIVFGLLSHSGKTLIQLTPVRVRVSSYTSAHRYRCPA